MEIIAITGILGTLAVIVLVILRPWDGLGRLAALALFLTPRPRPRHAGTPRTPQQVWDDGPVPPVGSMDYDAELKYRAMAGLPPPPDPLAEHLRRSGAELTAKLDAQRAAWAEPRPAVLLLPPDGDDSGPEWPPDGPGGGAQPPGPAGPPDGASAPPGAWRGQYGVLAPPHACCCHAGRSGEHDCCLHPRPRLPLPPWATEGGTWQIPAMPPPPEPELPPSGDWAPGTGPPEGDCLPPGDDDMDANADGLRLAYRRDGLDIADPDPPGTVVIGPGADLACSVDHGGQPCPGYPEPAEPSRLADPGELFRAQLASEVQADMRAQNADTAEYLDRQAAELAATDTEIRG